MGSSGIESIELTAGGVVRIVQKAGAKSWRVWHFTGIGFAMSELLDTDPNAVQEQAPQYQKGKR